MVRRYVQGGSSCSGSGVSIFPEDKYWFSKIFFMFQILEEILFQLLVFHIMDFQRYSIKTLFLLNMMLMRSVVEC